MNASVDPKRTSETIMTIMAIVTNAHNLYVKPLPGTNPEVCDDILQIFGSSNQLV